ncbi:MAG: flavin reductase family protein [Planctomycetota bacterium]
MSEYHEVTGTEAMGYLATKPTIIVTTLHESGVINAGVFGAYTNLSPSQVGAAISTGSHTYENILREEKYVINVPRAEIVDALSILADSLPEDKSEVYEAGLCTRDGVVLDVPSICQCAAAVEMRFQQEIPIGHHSFLIGECVGGWIKEEYLDDDGKIDIFAAEVIKDFKYPKPLYVLPGKVIEG